MKKVLICIIGFMQIYMVIFNAAPVDDVSWNLATNTKGIKEVQNIDESLDTYSPPLDFSKASVTVSDMWDIEEKNGYISLNNKGAAIVGQWIRFNNVSFIEDGKKNQIDFVVTIKDARMIKSYTEQTYIRIADDFSSMYTSGYLEIDFNINFFEPGTSNPLTITPMLRVGDIDKNEVIGTSLFLKNLNVTPKSELEYTLDGANNLISSKFDASPNDEDKWVAFNYGSTSEINLIFGMNRLNSDNRHNVEGEYTTFDLRLKSGESKISLNNIDEDQIPIAGSNFGIYNQGVVVDKVETNSFGYAESKELEPGDYTIKQLNISEQYVMNSEPYQAQIRSNSDGQVVGTQQLITNKVITGDIKLNVIDAEENGVRGVTLSVYDRNTNKKVATVVTDESGKASVGDLDYGKYYVSIESVPTRFNLSEEQINFIIENNDEILELTPIKIDDADQDGLGTGYIRISTSSSRGTKYYVYDEDGNLVDTIVVDGEGNGMSKSLPFGSYCIKGDGQQLCIELTAETSMQEFVLGAETDGSSKESNSNISSQFESKVPSNDTLSEQVNIVGMSKGTKDVASENSDSKSAVAENRDTNSEVEVNFAQNNGSESNSVKSDASSAKKISENVVMISVLIISVIIISITLALKKRRKNG